MVAGSELKKLAYFRSSSGHRYASSVIKKLATTKDQQSMPRAARSTKGKHRDRIRKRNEGSNHEIASSRDCNVTLLAPSSHADSPNLHQQSSESLNIQMQHSVVYPSKTRGGANTGFELRPPSKGDAVALRQKQFEMGPLSEVKEQAKNRSISNKGTMPMPSPHEEMY